MIKLVQLLHSLTGPTVNYKQMIKQGSLLIDVRSKEEFNAGHAKQSLNIPLKKIKDCIYELKGKEVILVCRSGARAAQAKSILTKIGIKAHNGGTYKKYK